MFPECINGLQSSWIMGLEQSVQVFSYLVKIRIRRTFEVKAGLSLTALTKYIKKITNI